MQKNVILLAIAGLFPLLLWSQPQPQRIWSEGKLTWSDFQLRNYNSMAGTELVYRLSYQPDKQKMQDTVLRRLQARAWMDTSQSWVRPDQRTTLNLRYNQVVFDLVELYRRVLQTELDQLFSFWYAEEKFRTVQQMCYRRIHEFQEESGYGNKESAIGYWESLVQRELEALPDLSRPQFEKRKLGYGINLGLGTGTATGTLDDYFRHNLYLTYGFDLSYQKTLFFLNATLGSATLKKNIDADPIWAKGERATLAIIDISVGYPVYEGRKFRVVPFVGGGVTEYSLLLDDKDAKSPVKSDFNLLGGINVDYVLRKKITLTPDYMRGRAINNSSLRGRFYVTKANLAPEMKGYTLNLTVGWALYGNVIRLSDANR